MRHAKPGVTAWTLVKAKTWFGPIHEKILLRNHTQEPIFCVKKKICHDTAVYAAPLLFIQYIQSKFIDTELLLYREITNFPADFTRITNQ